jgi:hypothetical protein
MCARAPGKAGRAALIIAQLFAASHQNDQCAKNRGLRIAANDLEKSYMHDDQTRRQKQADEDQAVLNGVERSCEVGYELRKQSE